MNIRLLTIGAIALFFLAACVNTSPHRTPEQEASELQFALGIKYRNGDGVEQDYQEALAWYQLSASQGHAEAKNHIGNMYKKGLGVGQDYAEAAKWYRMAAEEGAKTAQVNLGDMYYEGSGLKQDYAEAVKWYRQAAEQGSARAQNNLGYMYHKGTGVKQNDIIAYMWWYLLETKDIDDDEAKAKFAKLKKTITPENVQKAKQKAKLCLESKFKQCE